RLRGRLRGVDLRGADDPDRAGATRRRRRTGGDVKRGIVIHAILVVATLATLYPILWVLKMALSPSQGFSLSANPLPQAVTLQNFRDVIGAHDAAGHWLFGHQLVNSLIVSVAVT